MGGQRNQRYPFNRGGSGGQSDKSSIEHVINYDLPSTMFSDIHEYVYRTGRTARIGDTGKQRAVGSTSGAAPLVSSRSPLLSLHVEMIQTGKINSMLKPLIQHTAISLSASSTAAAALR